MPKREKAPEVAEIETTPVVEAEAAPATTAVEVEAPDSDDQDESDELDAVFEDAIAAAPLEEGGDDGKTKASESAPVEKEGEPAKEVPAEEAVVAEGAKKPEVPASAEEPPKEEPPVEQPAVEIPAPLDPARLQADFDKWRGDAEKLLAEQHYNLTEDQAEEFDANPSAVMPVLAAKLHMEVLQQSVALIARMIPSIMQNVQTLQTDQNSKEEKFFEQWPELKVHRDEVVRHGSVYVQMNPGASFDEFVRDVGAQVAIAKKVDLSARQPIVEAPKVAAYKPIASAGGAGATQPDAKPGVFGQLYEDAVATDADF